MAKCEDNLRLIILVLKIQQHVSHKGKQNFPAEASLTTNGDFDHWTNSIFQTIGFDSPNAFCLWGLGYCPNAWVLAVALCSSLWHPLVVSLLLINHFLNCAMELLIIYVHELLDKGETLCQLSFLTFVGWERWRERMHLQIKTFAKMNWMQYD